jgi:hypothetical protein
MLRVEKQSDGTVMRLLLSGRIQSDSIPCIRSAMNGASTRKVLDLGEVTLVDIDAIQFLMDCEDEGAELVRCPSFIRAWIRCERTEEAAARQPQTV